jgi:CO dehydrogenase/acetyl-CoA synthase delta subunit
MPGKEEAIRRIRMVNGMSDPDMSEDDPEMIAKKQSEEEAQQRQAEYEATLQSLDIQEREARIQKIGVEAESKQAKIGMDQQKINIAKAKALHEFQNPKPTPQVNVANPSNNRKSIRKDK